jgi:hypothetical protein
VIHAHGVQFLMWQRGREPMHDIVRTTIADIAQETAY